MSTKLYTPEDNERLSSLIVQLSDERFKELAQDTPTEPIVSLGAKPFKCTPFSLFGVGKKTKWNLDDSPIQPTLATHRAGKGFAKAYLDQLSAILYHGKEEPPMGELTELMYLYERIIAQGTIRVSSGTSVRRLPSIVLALNQFFVKNIHVIDAISTMVGNRIAPPVETPAP